MIKVYAVILLVCLIKLQNEIIINLIEVQGKSSMETIMEGLKSKLMVFFGEEIFTDKEEEEFTEAKIGSILNEWKFHGSRKMALGHRVQVLRVLVRRLHYDKRPNMSEFEFNVRCEKYLDNLLFKYEYRLEKAIGFIRTKCST